MALSQQRSRILKLISAVKPPSLFSSSNMLASFSSSSSSTRETTNPLNLDDADNNTSDLYTQNPPEPIPNRPLRSEKPNYPLKNARYNSAKNRNLRVDNSDRKTKDDDDNAFLEKFKLRVDENDRKNEVKERTEEEAMQPPPDAQEIFKKMKETGLIPNAVAMLDGLCKDGLVQEAMKLFGYMREKGTIPEVVVYTAVVEGFCKARKTDDAIRVFRKMGNNGISPNAFSFGVLIQGLCKCGCFDDAVAFCFEMVEAGHSPNVTTFVGLVDGVCKEKGVEQAQKLITNLRQKGFVINEKSVRQFLDRKSPLSSSLWEAIFGKKPF